MAAVAVRERVYPHQPVVEPAGDLVRGIGRVRDLHPGVLAQLVQLDADMFLGDAEVLVAGAKPPGPFPHPAEHAPVQVADEGFVQDVLRARAREPLHRRDDVFLFEAVKLLARGDVRGDEPFRFVGIERGRAVHGRGGHGSVPERLRHLVQQRRGGGVHGLAGLVPRQRLVLERHGTRRARHVLRGFLPCLLLQGFFQRGLRHQRVHQHAIHRLRRATQGLQRGGAARLRLLQGGDAHPADAKAFAELLPAHAERVPYRLDPAFSRRRQFAQRCISQQGCIQLLQRRFLIFPGHIRK